MAIKPLSIRPDKIIIIGEHKGILSNINGNLSATINELYTLTKGNTYRLKTTQYALNSNGSVAEYVTKYSSTITY